ncbi:hypothetical protein [Rothia nasimurium]|uniref:hypothetical protein n=1 Tax=Rothia nasimurium TaxID=85336 RepID=UPI001F25E6DA|nr:hypothetical protein [Rothia nasimurium]
MINNIKAKILDILKAAEKLFIANLPQFKKITNNNIKKFDILSCIHIYVLLATYSSALFFLASVTAKIILDRLDISKYLPPGFSFSLSFGFFNLHPALSISLWVVLLTILIYTVNNIRVQKILKINENEYIKQLFNISIVWLSTVLSIGSFKIAAICAIPILGILITSPFGTGAFSNFYQYIAYYIEVLRAELKESKQKENLSFSKIFINLVTPVLIFGLTYLISGSNFISSLVFSIVIILVSFSHANSKKKSIIIAKKFILYSLFALIAILTLFIEIQNDLSYLKILAIFITTFFAMDRLFQLWKDTMEVIQEKSLYYWFATDNIDLSKILQRIIYLDPNMKDSQDSLEREVLIQTIINFHIGNFKGVEKAIDFYRNNEYNKFDGAIKYFEAELFYEKNKYGDGQISNEGSTIIEKLLQESVNNQSDDFHIVDPAIVYGTILIQNGKEEEGMKILEKYRIFLDDEQIKLLERNSAKKIGPS